MPTEPNTAAFRPRIILASGSPRRIELVGRLGWEFVVAVPDVDEDIAGMPRDMVRILAERKARAVAAGHDAGVVLAADTLVAVDGKALGKPIDREDARRMLRLLSGRGHDVFTGVCMIDIATGRCVQHVERSAVVFRDMTDKEIDLYIATGEPMDKAGAYGAQGQARAFVERIDGSFENVMGLPVQVLPRMYQELVCQMVL